MPLSGDESRMFTSRCYAGVHDLDEFEGEEDGTVTRENPAYDNSFSHKAFKVRVPVKQSECSCLYMGYTDRWSCLCISVSPVCVRHCTTVPERSQ